MWLFIYIFEYILYDTSVTLYMTRTHHLKINEKV